MPPDSDLVLAPASLDSPLDPARVFGWAPGIRRPLELEVGCGKGLFLVQAAARWPDRDFIAVEQVRALVRKVSSKVRRAGLVNVRLLQAEAKEALAEWIPAGSLARVHVYFPDPWPKRRHARNRLFARPTEEERQEAPAAAGDEPRDGRRRRRAPIDFADAVARALEPGGELLLATDHDPYFREVVARLACHPAFVRTLPDVFREIPRGGFDAIFERAGVPAFRGAWQRLREMREEP